MAGDVADDGHRAIEFAFGNETVRDKDERSKIGQRGGTGNQHDVVHDELEGGLNARVVPANEVNGVSEVGGLGER